MRLVAFDLNKDGFWIRMKSDPTCLNLKKLFTFQEDNVLKNIKLMPNKFGVIDNDKSTN